MFHTCLLVASAAIVGLPAPAMADRCSVVVAIAPQDAGPTKPSAPPGGGTPEPTMLLLVAGGAVGYGLLRLARKRPASDAAN